MTSFVAPLNLNSQEPVSQLKKPMRVPWLLLVALLLIAVASALVVAAAVAAQTPGRAANGDAPQGSPHPLLPTCYGFGSTEDSFCMAATLPMGGSFQLGRGGGDVQTLAVRIGRVKGCSPRACWLQRARVAISGGGDGGGTGGLARVGVYNETGSLLAKSEEVSVPAGHEGWLELPLGGELESTSEFIWLAVQFDHGTTKVVFDEVATSAGASRWVAEGWEAGLANVRDWASVERGSCWDGQCYVGRVQVDLGDVSLLPGTLPLLLEAPHGGWIRTGWPKRISGRTIGDWNTALVTEQLRTELGRRCGGRKPSAVILRVSRQGLDANREYGDACCDLAEVADREMALKLHAKYHGMVSEQLAAQKTAAEGGRAALLVSIHGLSRTRVEVGYRLSTDDLNSGAGAEPPSLEPWQALSSVRALGPTSELLWGNQSFGALLTAARPGLEVVPSLQVPCPDPAICPNSTFAKYFRGGYSLVRHVTDTQPGMQFELPRFLRDAGTSPSAPDPAGIHQLGSALASFLNKHYWGNCDTE